MFWRSCWELSFLPERSSIPGRPEVSLLNPRFTFGLVLLPPGI